MAQEVQEELRRTQDLLVQNQFDWKTRKIEQVRADKQPMDNLWGSGQLTKCGGVRSVQMEDKGAQNLKHGNQGRSELSPRRQLPTAGGSEPRVFGPRVSDPPVLARSGVVFSRYTHTCLPSARRGEHPRDRSQRLMQARTKWNTFDAGSFRVLPTTPTDSASHLLPSITAACKKEVGRES